MIPIALIAGSRRRRRTRRGPQERDLSPLLPQEFRASRAIEITRPTPAYLRVHESDEHVAAMAARDRLDAKFESAGLGRHRLSSAQPLWHQRAYFTCPTARCEDPGVDYLKTRMKALFVHESSSSRLHSSIESTSAQSCSPIDSTGAIENSMGTVSRIAASCCRRKHSFAGSATRNAYYRIEPTETASNASIASTSGSGRFSDSNGTLENPNVALMQDSYGKSVSVDLGDCSICLESLSNCRAFLCLPCKHKFHRTCLNTWLKKHSHCPNCRSHVPKVGSLVEYMKSNEMMDESQIVTALELKLYD